MTARLDASRGVLAAAILAMTVSACSGTATSVPSAPTAANQNVSGAARHTRTFVGADSQPNPDSSCGTCSCGEDDSGSTPTSDQGAPCTGSSGGTSISGGGGAVGSGGTNGTDGAGGGDVTPPAGPEYVAVYTTPPLDGQRCGNNPGSGYGYHDNLNYKRNGVPAQVTNINEVVQAQGFPYNAGGQLMVQDTLIGWMYQDQWGYYYFQANPNLGWYPSVSVSYTTPSGFGVGFGLNAAPNTNPQQLMTNGSPATGTPTMPTGKAFNQCWSSLKLM